MEAKKGERATRASNALVAVTDFYSHELDSYRGVVLQQQQVIEQLAAQGRRAEERANAAENEHAKMLDAEAAKKAKRRLPKGAVAVVDAALDLMSADPAGYKSAERGSPAHDLYVATMWMSLRWRYESRAPLKKTHLPAGARRFLAVVKGWVDACDMEPDPDNGPRDALYNAFKRCQAAAAGK